MDKFTPEVLIIPLPRAQSYKIDINGLSRILPPDAIQLSNQTKMENPSRETFMAYLDHIKSKGPAQLGVDYCNPFEQTSYIQGSTCFFEISLTIYNFISSLMHTMSTLDLQSQESRQKFKQSTEDLMALIENFEYLKEPLRSTNFLTPDFLNFISQYLECINLLMILYVSVQKNPSLVLKVCQFLISELTKCATLTSRLNQSASSYLTPIIRTLRIYYQIYLDYFAAQYALPSHV